VETLVVNEIYSSLQGESSWTGLPCVFVRLTGCNLRCSYCDSAYAFHEGTRWDVEDVRRRIHELAQPYPIAPGAPRLPLVEFTGGEPLLQRPVFPLLTRLCDDGFRVLLETSGAVDIAPVDPRVHRIMDLKCPSSGEMHRNRWDNLACLRSADEIKFVVGTAEDCQWVRDVIAQRALAAICPLLVSWAAPLTTSPRDPSLRAVPEGQHPIGREELVRRILADAWPVRFQIQMHKILWAPDRRGV